MRAVIVGCTKALVPSLIQHLPSGIHVADSQERFDAPWIEMRLEGDGLPEWCEVTSNQFYARALVFIDGSGAVNLVQPLKKPEEQDDILAKLFKNLHTPN